MIIFRLINVILLVIFCFGSSLFAIPFTKDTDIPKILILHSYQKGLDWTDDINRGFVEELNQAYPKAEIYVEYMDSKRVFDDEYVKILFRLFEHKYTKKDVTFDLILSSDNNALSFLVDHRNELFGEVPVVFCGVNYFRKEMLKKERLFTGFGETPLVLKETLDLALKINPNLKHVYSYGAKTPTFQANLKALSLYIPDYEGILEFHIFDDKRITQIREHLKSLPDDSIVLVMGTVEEDNGERLALEEYPAQIIDVCPVPMYTSWDYFIGPGCLGGSVITGFSQGQAAADEGVEILKGTPFDSFPPQPEGPRHYMFDYRQLERFGISHKSLPGDSKIIYQPKRIDAQTLRWIIISLIALFVQAVIISVLLWNIFNRRRMEKKLRLSEQKFNNMVLNSPDMFMLTDNNGKITYISPQVKDVIGHKVEDFVGIDFPAEYIHPDDLESAFTNFNKVIQGETLIDFEYRFYDKNKKIQWLNHTARPIMEDGEIIIIQNNVRNITKDKNAEIALASEKEQLAVTLRSIGDGVITTDTDGYIVMINKVAEALTGWNLKEAIGHLLPEVFNIINENTLERCENPVERVLASGGIIELENHTCLIAKDGREIVIADSGAPIRNKESKIIGVVLVFRDMTEKQKYEDSLQNSQKLESLGILAGGIAHDFNNILGAIFGYNELAMLQTKEEKVSSYLTKSLSSIDRARSLTEQLLTFAKGGAPIKKVENLFPFVQETTQFALSGSSVSADFQVEENLWACEFDKNRIGQVIDNLTINAQQAMPRGGTILISAINISLSEKEHMTLTAGNYVKLSIKDQGIGIPKESLTNIFDPYYTTKHNGHGLGLSTCFSIINRHDGCIEVESEPGKGSTFHIYLPAAIDPVRVSC